MAQHELWLCVHYDLDLKDITLGQGQDMLLGHGEWLC